MMKTPLLVLAVNSLFACASIQAAVVGYWKFEEGAFLDDSSGNGYHLTTNTNAVQVALPATGNGSEYDSAISGNGSAAQFSGNGRLAVAYNSNFKTSTMTLEALVTTTATSGTQAIAGSWNANSNRLYLIALSSNVLVYFIDGVSISSGLPALVANADYYVGIGIDLSDAGKELTFYQKNLTTGEIWTSVVASTKTALPSGTASFAIGSTSANSSYFNGLIDEVRISNTKLGPDDLLVQVPEPAAALLGGIAALLGLRRKRVA